MFDPGTVVFLAQFTPANERTLYPGTVTESDDHSFTVQFADPVQPSTTSDVILYAQADGKFLRQPAAIIALRRADAGHPLIAFRPTADAVSVDKRLHARVSVAALGMYARIARTPKCTVLDISPAGFAAIGAHEYNVGDEVDVAMTYPGLTCSGKARIQTKTPLPNGTYRYGFLSTDPKSSMRRMLAHITASVRRLQLDHYCQTA